jgi:hypothetical protein
VLEGSETIDLDVWSCAGEQRWITTDRKSRKLAIYIIFGIEAKAKATLGGFSCSRGLSKFRLSRGFDRFDRSDESWRLEFLALTD